MCSVTKSVLPPGTGGILIVAGLVIVTPFDSMKLYRFVYASCRIWMLYRKLCVAADRSGWLIWGDPEGKPFITKFTLNAALKVARFQALKAFALV